MPDSKHTKLPDSPLGENRYAELGFTGHGDIKLSFWQSAAGNSKPKNFRMFQLAHGSEATLVACMAGYYRRLGVTSQKTQATFKKAGKNILSDESLLNSNFGGQHDGFRSLGSIASGQEVRRFDNKALGWSCLHQPIPPEPGSLNSGTGLYTRTDILGNFTLLLAYRGAGTDKTSNADSSIHKHVAELCRPDIPPVVKLICDSSMGLYRKQVFNFLQQL